MNEIEIPTGMAVLAIAGIVAFFILLIWSMKRHRDPKLKVDCDAAIENLLPSLAGLTLGSVVDGNAVEVLEDGAFSTP
jgi:cardiolipin synthase